MKKKRRIKVKYSIRKMEVFVNQVDLPNIVWKVETIKLHN